MAQASLLSLLLITAVLVAGPCIASVAGSRDLLQNAAPGPTLDAPLGLEAQRVPVPGGQVKLSANGGPTTQPGTAPTTAPAPASGGQQQPTPAPTSAPQQTQQTQQGAVNNCLEKRSLGELIRCFRERRGD